MKTVITYGTYDLLHYGHIRLLERAKALGDYLIVGVTSDDFDKTRGKINVQQSLMERIENIRATGLANQIIVEEYEGQKIDDIKRYGVDIFTVGSDWVGRFDYLNEYCKVVYLDRTQGVSSSELRTKSRLLSMGLIGDYAPALNAVQSEDKFVNGIEISGICTTNLNSMNDEIKNLKIITEDYKVLLNKVESIYLKGTIEENYDIISYALSNKKHVLCEGPIVGDKKKFEKLLKLANDNNCILMDGIRTAYATAFNRLLLLIKAGKIGNVVSVDVNCSNMKNITEYKSFKDWGSIALLPILQILGTNYNSKKIISKFLVGTNNNDIFTKVDFIFPNSVASLKVSEGAKTEGELVITGTKGYIYVPAPWWKTEYFEVRYEDPTNNRRYYYQLDGEGIRYELVTFIKSIQCNKNLSNISEEISKTICDIMNDFDKKIDLIEI